MVQSDDAQWQVSLKIKSPNATRAINFPEQGDPGAELQVVSRTAILIRRGSLMTGD